MDDFFNTKFFKNIKVIHPNFKYFQCIKKLVTTHLRNTITPIKHRTDSNMRGYILLNRSFNNTH